MEKFLAFRSAIVVSGCLALVATTQGCTKTANKSQPPGSNGGNTGGQPTASPSQSPGPGGGNAEAQLQRFSLSSIAGENVFCQTFSTANQMAGTDFETLLNGMAGAQAGIPSGLLNPFTVQTLALAVQQKPCEKVSELLSKGHCALVVNKQFATGNVAVRTEQRVFWKDVPTLAQASSVKVTIDNKTAILSAKNAIFENLQKQISQQRLLMQILQGTSGNSTLFREAEALLGSLQEQTRNLEGEIKGLEGELKPLQDELNKRIEELNTARAALRLACTPSGMGAASATWSDN